MAQNEAFLSLLAETANFRIESLTLPGGRAANTINCMVQGPDDFLWIASHGGLHRYDGREVNQFKSRFYTNITHEFRTPLRVIKGIAAQIKDEEIRAMIQRNSDRLLIMVNQLLELSKLENSKLSIDWVHGDVNVYLYFLARKAKKEQGPIGDIAAAVGFKSFSHFSRSFVKEFGDRPSDIRS